MTFCSLWSRGESKTELNAETPWSKDESAISCFVSCET